MKTVSHCNRRQFITASLACLSLAACGSSKSQAVYLSASTDANGQHYATALNADGQLYGKIPLPNRAHQAIMAPNGYTGIYISRRPDKQLYIIDWHQKKHIATINAETQHHFYGHGVFTHDGKHLLTTENFYQKDRHAGQGKIVVRETQNYTIVDEYNSGGIGPHQLALLSDNTLVVANGGIQTHPSQPRKKLNLDTMQSNISYLQSGKLIDQQTLHNRHSSLRHLAISDNNTVVIGVQQQANSDCDSLIYTSRVHQTLTPVAMPQSLIIKNQHYTASISCAKQGPHAAISCPKGGQLVFINTESNTINAIQTLRDAAGVCTHQDHPGFVVSSGLGSLHYYTIQGQHQGRLSHHPYQWDNHLSV